MYVKDWLWPIRFNFTPTSDPIPAGWKTISPLDFIATSSWTSLDQKHGRGEGTGRGVERSVPLICTRKRKKALGRAKRVQWVNGREGGGLLIHLHGGSWTGRGLTVEQAASLTLGVDPSRQASYPRKVWSHHSLKASSSIFCALAHCSYFKVQFLFSGWVSQP